MYDGTVIRIVFDLWVLRRKIRVAYWFFSNDFIPPFLGVDQAWGSLSCCTSLCRYTSNRHCRVPFTHLFPLFLPVCAVLPLCLLMSSFRIIPLWVGHDSLTQRRNFSCVTSLYACLFLPDQREWVIPHFCFTRSRFSVVTSLRRIVIPVSFVEALRFLIFKELGCRISFSRHLLLHTWLTLCFHTSLSRKISLHTLVEWGFHTSLLRKLIAHTLTTPSCFPLTQVLLVFFGDAILWFSFIVHLSCLPSFSGSFHLWCPGGNTFYLPQSTATTFMQYCVIDSIPPVWCYFAPLWRVSCTLPFFLSFTVIQSTITRWTSISLTNQCVGQLPFWLLDVRCILPYFFLVLVCREKTHTFSTYRSSMPYSQHYRCTLAGRSGLVSEVDFRQVDVSARTIEDSDDDAPLTHLSNEARLAQKGEVLMDNLEVLFDNDEVRIDHLNTLLSDTDVDDEESAPESIASSSVEEIYTAPPASAFSAPIDAQDTYVPPRRTGQTRPFPPSMPATATPPAARSVSPDPPASTSPRSGTTAPFPPMPQSFWDNQARQSGQHRSPPRFRHRRDYRHHSSPFSRERRHSAHHSDSRNRPFQSRYGPIGNTLYLAHPHWLPLSKGI